MVTGEMKICFLDHYIIYEILKGAVTKKNIFICQKFWGPPLTSWDQQKQTCLDLQINHNFILHIFVWGIFSTKIT